MRISLESLCVYVLVVFSYDCKCRWRHLLIIFSVITFNNCPCSMSQWCTMITLITSLCGLWFASISIEVGYSCMCLQVHILYLQLVTCYCLGLIFFMSLRERKNDTGIFFWNSFAFILSVHRSSKKEISCHCTLWQLIVTMFFCDHVSSVYLQFFSASMCL